MTGTGQPSARGPEEAGPRPAWRRARGTPPPSSPPPAPDPPEFDDRTIAQQPLSPAPPRAVSETSATAPSGPATDVFREDLPKIPGLSLTREIGRGGMGIVYLGKQGYLDRRVAVKLLAQGSQSEEFTRRFQREAKILASLNHPHVVACYQAGVAPDGRCYLAMEYIDGPTLGDWIQSHGPLPHDRAVELCRAVASALAHAHRAGIIHRDVKPANVLLKSAAGKPQGDPFPYEPMLADLGLARASKGLPTMAEVSLKGLTVQGAVMGSPPTMAPEQFDHPDKVDFRTDIYGLGCVLFHCLTGKLAFPQATLTSLIARKAEGRPPDPRELRRDVSSDLAELVRAMLAPSIADRPASYEVLLQRLAGPFEPGRRTPRALVWGAAALLVLGGGGLAARGLGGGAAPPRGAAPDEGRETPGGARDAEVAGLDRVGGTGGAGEDGQGGTSAPSRLADPERTGEQPGAEPGADEGAQEAGAAPRGAAEGQGGAEEPTDATGTGGEVEAPSASEDKTSEPGGEREDQDPPVAAEPEIVLPVLPPIRSGEEWPLLVAPFEAWSATAEALGWSRAEETQNGVDWVLYEGDAATERGLPAPPWTLSGKLRLVRPERMLTERLLVVVALEGVRGILLEQAMTEEAVTLSAALGHRQESGGWLADQELEPLSLGTLTREAYGDAAPVSFEVAWDGELLALTWSLATTPEGGAPRAELTRQELRDLGFPVALGLELKAGVASLRELSIRGR